MNNFAQGSYAGTGEAVNVIIGFKPTAIFFFNSTDTEMSGCWTQAMSEEDTPILGFKDVGGTQSAITSGGITVLDEDDSSSGMGFTVGTDADFNTASDVVFYVAFG